MEVTLTSLDNFPYNQKIVAPGLEGAGAKYWLKIDNKAPPALSPDFDLAQKTGATSGG